MIETPPLLGEVTDELEPEPDEGPPIRDQQAVLTEAHAANARAQAGKHDW